MINYFSLLRICGAGTRLPLGRVVHTVTHPTEEDTMALGWFGKSERKQTERERFVAKLHVRRGLSVIRTQGPSALPLPALFASSLVPVPGASAATMRRAALAFC